jgi:hypothetical protein
MANFVVQVWGKLFTVTSFMKQSSWIMVVAQLFKIALTLHEILCFITMYIASRQRTLSGAIWIHSRRSIPLLQNEFSYYPPIHTWASQVAYFLQVFQHNVWHMSASCLTHSHWFGRLNNSYFVKFLITLTFSSPLCLEHPDCGRTSFAPPDVTPSTCTV